MPKQATANATPEKHGIASSRSSWQRCHANHRPRGLAQLATGSAAAEGLRAMMRAQMLLTRQPEEAASLSVAEIYRIGAAASSSSPASTSLTTMRSSIPAREAEIAGRLVNDYGLTIDVRPMEHPDLNKTCRNGNRPFHYTHPITAETTGATAADSGIFEESGTTMENNCLTLSNMAVIWVSVGHRVAPQPPAAPATVISSSAAATAVTATQVHEVPADLASAASRLLKLKSLSSPSSQWPKSQDSWQQHNDSSSRRRLKPQGLPTSAGSMLTRTPPRLPRLSAFPSARGDALSDGSFAPGLVVSGLHSSEAQTSAKTLSTPLSWNSPHQARIRGGRVATGRSFLRSNTSMTEALGNADASSSRRESFLTIVRCGSSAAGPPQRSLSSLWKDPSSQKLELAESTLQPPSTPLTMAASGSSLQHQPQLLRQESVCGSDILTVKIPSVDYE